jgi:FkbM family methyltransferase
MAPTTHADYEEVLAVHPHWEGHLLLSRIDNKLVHKETGSKGTYARNKDVIFVHWEKFPPERFILSGGVFVQHSMLAVDLQKLTVGTLFNTYYQVASLSIIVPGFLFPVYIRSDTSDLKLFQNIFIDQAYNSRHLPTNAKIIIDLGANIGLTSVFFANKYPNARIVSVESDQENFKILQNNLIPFGSRVKALQGAASSEDGMLNLHMTMENGTDIGALGAQVSRSDENSDAEVYAYSLPTLINMLDADVDILKVDIEGAEFDIFSSENSNWVNKVKLIIIDTHDRFRPGADEAVRIALSQNFVELPRKGDNLFFRAKRNMSNSKTTRKHLTTVSVLTDAVSSDFYFPLWHKYYGRHFGENNLHVISFGGEERSFSKFALGSLVIAPGYEEFDRAQRVSEKCAALLEESDFVIRCDVDEFIVPDPRHYSDIRHYITELNDSYVTSYGYNVIQAETEPPLDLIGNILTVQRRYAYPMDSLCKTCIVSSPLRWDIGFHNASKPPKFNELYLFHMKLADLSIQAEIGTMIARRASEERLQKYHSTPMDNYREEARRRLARPILKGFDAFAARAYFDAFLKRVAPKNGLFGVTKFDHNAPAAEIPIEFAGYL